jgi:hypothetical protein
MITQRCQHGLVRSECPKRYAESAPEKPLTKAQGTEIIRLLRLIEERTRPRIR